MYHFNKYTVKFMIDVVENLDFHHLIFVILLLSRTENWLKNCEKISIIISIKFSCSCQLIYYFSDLNSKNINEWQLNLYIHLYIVVIRLKNIKIFIVIIIHIIFIKIEAVEFNMSILQHDYCSWSAYNNSCDLCKNWSCWIQDVNFYDDYYL